MQAYREKNKKFRHIISSPFIYGVFIPFVLMDIGVELYHRICFSLYGIPYVSRDKYIRVDRQKLSYLTGVQKINCMYCGYMNGLIHYVSAIAGETEKYWCGIHHESDDTFKTPTHHKDFLKYNDKESFDAFLGKS